MMGNCVVTFDLVISRKIKIMSSEKLERCCDELKALLDNIQDSITYQLPKKLGGDLSKSVRLINPPLYTVHR